MVWDQVLKLREHHIPVLTTQTFCHIQNDEWLTCNLLFSSVVAFGSIFWFHQIQCWSPHRFSATEFGKKPVTSPLCKLSKSSYVCATIWMIYPSLQTTYGTCQQSRHEEHGLCHKGKWAFLILILLLLWIDNWEQIWFWFGNGWHPIDALAFTNVRIASEKLRLFARKR